MVSEKQEVQAGEVEQEAPKTAPKTTRTRKPKATEQAKTEAAEKAADAPAQESPTVQENTPETDAPEKAAESPAQESPTEKPAQEAQDQEKPADAQDDAPAEKPVQESPQADLNSLSVTNSGATTFCRVSGKTIATGQTVTISYKNAILKSKAKRNFEQLNELAGKKRFSVEG